ncbi:hypothetical protein DPMN_169568 [Dreissena polymorpha]|uniref:Uncharacterized protein n=1 Tax=Dreissena polymorpha TaxID=45954 RepID=A0A9D4DWT2_DREPO|nr:hypothetical protein DPMN_169568 [Dreissena polymorpha]
MGNRSGKHQISRASHPKKSALHASVRSNPEEENIKDDNTSEIQERASVASKDDEGDCIDDEFSNGGYKL